MDSVKEQSYWNARYQEGNTGWDIGKPSTPLKTYIDQLSDKEIKILVPGAGNAHEAEYLWKGGFKNIFVLDISPLPLSKFKERNPDFPEAQLLQENFFAHAGQYDLILEQTFFCSFVPTDENRYAYARQMAALLRPMGKLTGVWFDFPLSTDMEKRPFGGHKELYEHYLGKYLEIISFERCYNSIPPRKEKELFGVLRKGMRLSAKK